MTREAPAESVQATLCVYVCVRAHTCSRSVYISHSIALQLRTHLPHFYLIALDNDSRRRQGKGRRDDYLPLCPGEGRGSESLRDCGRSHSCQGHLPTEYQPILIRASVCGVFWPHKAPSTAQLPPSEAAVSCLSPALLWACSDPDRSRSASLTQRESSIFPDVPDVPVTGTAVIPATESLGTVAWPAEC